MVEPITPHFLWKAHRALTIGMATTGFMLVGICAVAVGLLHNPLVSDFHWSNSAASGLATVYSLASLLSGPVAGVIIDRCGSRHAMTTGTLLAGLGFLGLSVSDVLIEFYLAFVLIGIGYGGAFFLSSTKIIATRMGEKKNVGMGIWMFAGSMGAAFFSLAIDWWILQYGWRMTAGFAGVLILCMLPVIYGCIPRDTPITVGQLAQPVREPMQRNLPLESMRSAAFIIMTAASVFASFGMSAVYFHTVPILVDAGFTETVASQILGASWVLSAVGSLLAGMLSDHFGTKTILIGSLLLGAIGTGALLLAHIPSSALFAVIVFIVLWGATANAINQFLPLLLMDYYGPLHLAALVGIQGAVMGAVGSFAPFITGALYDRYSSYQVSVVASVATTFIAMLLVIAMRRTTSSPQLIQGRG